MNDRIRLLAAPATACEAALATVVGVLVEVPAMLSVVHIVRSSWAWYENSGAASRA